MKLLVVGFFLLPFLWMGLSSFKSALQIIELPLRLLFWPTLQNYVNVFATQNFLRFFWNSAVIGVGSTALGLVLGLPAAYSIARHKQRGLALAILSDEAAARVRCETEEEQTAWARGFRLFMATRSRFARPSLTSCHAETISGVRPVASLAATTSAIENGSTRSEVSGPTPTRGTSPGPANHARAGR